ncbi:MAG: acetyl-CoA hydrolase/transferase C-terminal domain-containing protein [Povalibacter sp.]
MTIRITDPDACVEATLSRVGKHIVLGLPVAIGKPNPLVNAFVRRACDDPAIHLTIITALSLRVPKAHGELERRFVEPFAQRVFCNYPDLEYMRLIEEGRLPANIEVIEFFLEPGAWLRNEHLQQHYLSANYTHVGRDALRRGMNVIAQIVAPPPPGEMPSGVLSLGANPDLTADLLPQIAAMRASGRPFALIGQVHRELPFMYGDALVTADTFDFLLDDTVLDFPLFCPPNMPIPPTEHAIALNVSTLLRDGGTLQLGIGELGDAIVYSTQLRHQQPAIYRQVLEDTGVLERHRRLIETEGGTAPFERGLYGCSEMLVDGFLDLYRSGVLKRCVYPSARIQRLLDDGHIDENINQRTLEALSASGMNRMSYADFNELRDVGVFRDDVQYERGVLIAPDGTQLAANFVDPTQRASIASTCLGERLRNGVLVDAGFFFGPKDFYSELRELPEAQRRLFAMRGISFVNELYGPEWELKVAQRRYARFVNTTMMVTGLGAAVSDGLENGRVVSGVGGQYNFVAMAHSLAEARSILCLRSTRTAHGRITSSLPWSYGHSTIPRHLRDIVVTEYGIADLRGKTDCETATALINVMDARFQQEFVAAARNAGKLPRTFQIPETARANRPEVLAQRFAPWRERGLFGELPFGSEFTKEELVLARALRSLGREMNSWSGRARLFKHMIQADPTNPQLRSLMQRMRLDQPKSITERLQRRLLATVLIQDHSGRPT